MTVQAERLKPKPWNHGQARARFEQCEFTVEEMSPTSSGPPGWRQRRYASKGLNPDQCAHPSAVLIQGRKLCNKHAGAVALSIVLGEVGQ